MLLPEAFTAGAAPVAFLAWEDDSAGNATVIGAAACHRLRGETVNTRVRTIAPYRRRGVGSALLAAICRAASDRGDSRVCTRVDFAATPDAAPFLAANGFTCGPRGLHVEGALAGLVPRLRDFRERMHAGGKTPAAARVLPESALSPSDLARIFRDLVEPALDSPPVAALRLAAGEPFDATVLLLGDDPIGVMVGRRTDANACAAIEALAVAPPFRGGWGWANLLLLSHGGERALASGANRIRFDVDETNWRILPSIARIDGIVTTSYARFIRDLRT